MFYNLIRDVDKDKDRRCCCDSMWQLEDGIEKWIKKGLGVGE